VDKFAAKPTPSPSESLIAKALEFADWTQGLSGDIIRHLVARINELEKGK
jgi:hypothetical protein